MSKSQKLQVHTAQRLDQALIAGTLFGAVWLCTVRKMCVFRKNIYMIKKVAVHKVVIALVIVFCQPLVLIQIDCSDSGEIQIALFVPVHQLLVCTDGSGACGKTQHTVRLHNDLGRNDICRFAAHVAVVSSFVDFHRYILLKKYFSVIREPTLQNIPAYGTTGQGR